MQPLGAHYPGMTGERPDRLVAAAIIATEAGRYLMQRRDDIPSVTFAGHWGCFGGEIEDGETAETALRRELTEELALELGSIELFAEIRPLLLFSPPRLHQISFFATTITEAEVSRLAIREGAELGLLRPDELSRRERVIPWDLAAILMHARRDILFKQ